MRTQLSQVQLKMDHRGRNPRKVSFYLMDSPSITSDDPKEAAKKEIQQYLTLANRNYN